MSRVASLSWASPHTLSSGSLIYTYIIYIHTQTYIYIYKLIYIYIYIYIIYYMLHRSRDSLILNHDVRSENHRCSTFEGHRQEGVFSVVSRLHVPKIV